MKRKSKTMANGKRNTKMQRSNRKRTKAVGKARVTKATGMKMDYRRNKMLRNSKGLSRNVYPQRRGTELIYSTTESDNEIKVVSLFLKLDAFFCVGTSPKRYQNVKRPEVSTVIQRALK